MIRPEATDSPAAFETYLSRSEVERQEIESEKQDKEDFRASLDQGEGYDPFEEEEDSDFADYDLDGGSDHYGYDPDIDCRGWD